MKADRHILAREFEELYFDNYAVLCKSIYRFIKDQEITKDIVQDVFIKYWQRMHELRAHESPVAYLRRACVNQALNYLKEQDRRANREQVYFDEASVSRGGDQPDIKMQEEETARKIQSAIDDLPPACRSTFLLSRYEQKSYKEIAAVMKISVNTVEKHIGKALKKLRKALRDKSAS